MDDDIGQPSSAHAPKVPKESGGDDSEGEEEAEGEDGGLDWTKLKIKPTASRPVIPKRGEKEFEPNIAFGSSGGGDDDSNDSGKKGEGGFAPEGSGLQLHILDQSRAAMFETISATRAVSSKTISRAIWYPTLCRAHVTLARGVHFANMGHSVLRVPSDDPSFTPNNDDDDNGKRMGTKGGIEKTQKRLELLPEETIYLVERGTLFCWKALSQSRALGGGEEGGIVEGGTGGGGSPMTVQQAYSEMIGLDGLTLEKFQVYAYLKRLGYVVTRASPPTPAYPTISPRPAWNSKSPTVFGRLARLFPLRWLQKIKLWISVRLGWNRGRWWKPVDVGKLRWMHHSLGYQFLFRALRFIPSGHRTPLMPQTSLKSKEDVGVGGSSKESPYRIFFNIYKPSTPFKKSAPPEPDFQMVVVNARTTPMPTLYELTSLFEELPELPPPVPRKKFIRPEGAAQHGPGHQQLAGATSSGPDVVPSAPPQTQPQPPRKPNPFVMLKTCRKAIVIAVVDSGSISFFRFGEGVFEQWPMV